MPVFYQHGLQGAPDALLADTLGTTVWALADEYPDRAALVHATILGYIERQKSEHGALYTQFPSAVERLYGLLKIGLRNMTTVPKYFHTDIQAHFPRTWETLMDYLANYSAPLLQQLLNDGIRSRMFRSDINIQLVTKILIEQLNLMLNPQVFPPDRYNMAEVFRSIFLYYVRGIYTDEGARVAAEHFARL